jgi:hypothetical protein
MIEICQELPYDSCFYSKPLLGPENWKRECTASGAQRIGSIGESQINVNSMQALVEDKWFERSPPKMQFDETV